jgi:hypothetical protein
MIGVVPAGGKLAFVVALNGDRLHHRNPDGHMGSRHPADALAFDSCKTLTDGWLRKVCTSDWQVCIQ